MFTKTFYFAEWMYGLGYANGVQGANAAGGHGK